MVRYINCFEVPEGREDDFLAMFADVNAFMTTQPGYIGHLLHRSLGTDARFRFVNYVEWDSVEDWRTAHGEQFLSMVRKPEWAGFTTTPGLYEVVDEKHI